MWTDDQLLEAMMSPSQYVARMARNIWDERHPIEDQPVISEPPHCSKCFEGCERCNWGKRC